VAPTTAPTQAATSAPIVVATPSTPNTPTTGASPTTAPVAQATPGASPTCRNNSTFVSDVTVPDGTTFAPGQSFTKTWRLRNSGTCAWTDGYELVFVRGTNMAAGSAAVPETTPGATADVQMQMTTPTSPGTHIGFYRMRTPNGTLFGDTVWVSIGVGGTPAAAPTVLPNFQPTPSAGAACVNNGVFVADITIPDGTQVAPGQQFIKTWQIRNTGTCAWDGGYTLAFVRGTAMTATTNVALPSAAPGATVDVSVTLTAPTLAGTYTSVWRPRAPDGTFFGHSVWATIRVGTGPAAAPPLVPGGATLDDPARAVSFGSAIPSLPAGSAQWLQFAYDNDENAIPRPTVKILLLNGVKNGLSFEVYSTESLTGNWFDNGPIGRGTQEVLTNCIEDNVNVGQCTTDNLSWTGGFGLTGPQFVRVINSTNTAVTPQLIISGPGLAQCLPPGAGNSPANPALPFAQIQCSSPAP
jgi:hypothetical protein